MWGFQGSTAKLFVREMATILTIALRLASQLQSSVCTRMKIVCCGQFSHATEDTAYYNGFMSEK